jgi:peptidoglycan hydrolase-like protein with peptidoglycan-binding domain
MSGIIEDEGTGLSPLNVVAFLLTAAFSAWIVWNALMNQPTGEAVFELAPGSAGLDAPAEVPASRTITLRYDPVVEEVQKALADSGYYTGPIDGVAGRRTRTAIEAFQSANGLDITGTATPELAERVRFQQTIAEAAGVTSSTTAHPSPDQDTLMVQRRLVEFGYLTGPIDGILDQRTRNAIRDFERDRGIAQTGDITYDLLTELGNTAGESGAQ